jgi:hypothetical protein
MAAALHGAPLEAPRDDATLVLPRPSEGAPAVAEETLNTIERKLARHVGPMARHLVQSAARRAGSLDELCDTLGQLIERPEQRVQFRQEVLANQTAATAARTRPAVATTAAVGAEEARRAEQELARYMGPIARILVKRALGAAGSADEFWQMLATHIGVEADRQAFLGRRS